MHDAEDQSVLARREFLKATTGALVVGLGASRVTIAIQATAKEIHIRVQDNGRGAAPEAFEAANAYGVMGMRERARHWGGTLEITSQIGLGSLFHLRIQLLNS